MSTGEGPDREPEPDEPVEPVAVAELPWDEAWLLAGRLRADGVPARVYPDSPGMPVTVAHGFADAGLLSPAGLARGRFAVIVPSEWADEARRIIAALPRRGGT